LFGGHAGKEELTFPGCCAIIFGDNGKCYVCHHTMKTEVLTTIHSDMGARTSIHGVSDTFSPFFLDGGAANLVQIGVQVEHANFAVASNTVLGSL